MEKSRDIEGGKREREKEARNCGALSAWLRVVWSLQGTKRQSERKEEKAQEGHRMWWAESTGDPEQLESEFR